MKTMLLMLAASLIQSVAESQIKADDNDVGIDDITGQALLIMATELRSIATANPPAEAPAKKTAKTHVNAAEPPPDRTTD